MLFRRASCRISGAASLSTTARTAGERERKRGWREWTLRENEGQTGKDLSAVVGG
jgi:hypothetical protein